jgi:hypothetical protein
MAAEQFARASRTEIAVVAQCRCWSSYFADHDLDPNVARRVSVGSGTDATVLGNVFELLPKFATA